MPETLPPHLSQQALEYCVGELTLTGIEPANSWYAAIDRGRENTSFLVSAVVQQPALFLTGEHDPSAKPLFGIARQEQAFASLKTNFTDKRDIVVSSRATASPNRNLVWKDTVLVRTGETVDILLDVSNPGGTGWPTATLQSITRAR